METLYILIPISVVLVFVIGILFWWSLRSGQFDDMEGPAYRMLMDDDHPESEGGEKPRELNGVRAGATGGEADIGRAK